MWGRHQPQPTSALWSSAVMSSKPSSKPRKENGSDNARRMPYRSIPPRMLSLSTPTMEWPTFQENGQRKYGPPEWWSGPPPPKGTEVFLSRLPRNSMEDELCPILSLVGTIYMFRLMMDFSGSNRGYGFAQYATREEALRAIKELNNYPIREGSIMTVEESLDNCRLFIGRIPRDLTSAKLNILLAKYLSGLKCVFLYMSEINKQENRGYCFVEFDDHRTAAMGRRYLLNCGIPEWNTFDITVDWALPEADSRVGKNKITTLCIRNLEVSTIPTDIKDLLDKHTINRKFVLKIRIVKESAFIQFSNSKVAEYALKCLDGDMLHGSRLMATCAMPSTSSSNQESYSYSLGHNNAGSIENGCSSGLDSLNSRNSGYNSPLLNRGQRRFKTKPPLPMLAAPPKFNNDFTPVYAPPTVPRELHEDYSTDLNGSPLTTANSSSSSGSFVEASYAPLDSHFPRLQSRQAVEECNCNDALDYMHGDGAEEKENLPFAETSAPQAATRSMTGIERGEYLYLGAYITMMLSEFTPFEVLLDIAETLEWGTIVYNSRECFGGWIAAIRVVKGEQVKNLYVLEYCCTSEAEALNEAAHKFICKYLLDHEMFLVSKVLFFP